MIMHNSLEKLRSFVNNRWLVFVCGMWVQSCSGIGYLFGSISPVIKSAMGYNQRQVAFLGVAKDLGDSIGFVAGILIEIVPPWVVMLIGAVQNFVGYGLVWLIVNQTLPAWPLWVLCIAIFVGTNGETYFNTGSLVPCVQNFPKNRGPVVGIQKGFAGLSGAILTQVYAMINAPNESSLIFMIAVGPSMVVIALMFIMRPVKGHKQVRSSDDSSFLFTYSICIILAAYVLGVIILEDLVSLSQSVITALSAILIILILLPIVIPVIQAFVSEPIPSIETSLLRQQDKETDQSEQNQDGYGSDVILSEVEDEKPAEMESLPAAERRKLMVHLQAKLFQAAAEGAVRIKKRKGPRRGEDFTLLQALMKADFLLMFFSLVLASGSGITVIDNLGQISESLGYTDTSIFVSMISIWNFLGRVGGGYFSEVVVRKFSYPRPVAMAVFQFLMALGFLYCSMGWPGEIYVLSIVIGIGYGAHWSVMPASISELFGLKSFGALYNFLTLGNPVGSLVFSGVIASGIYDYYAEKQAGLTHLNTRTLLGTNIREEESLTCVGTVCYSLTFGILSGLCIVAVILSLIVVHRTKSVYAHLYGNNIIA